MNKSITEISDDLVHYMNFIQTEYILIEIIENFNNIFNDISYFVINNSPIQNNLFYDFRYNLLPTPSRLIEFDVDGKYKKYSIVDNIKKYFDQNLLHDCILKINTLYPLSNIKDEQIKKQIILEKINILYIFQELLVNNKPQKNTENYYSIFGKICFENLIKNTPITEKINSNIFINFHKLDTDSNITTQNKYYKLGYAILNIVSFYIKFHKKESSHE